MGRVYPFFLSFSLEYCVCFEDQKKGQKRHKRRRRRHTQTTTTTTRVENKKRERERESAQIIHAITKEAFFSTRKSSTTTTNHLLHHLKRSRIRRLRIWARRCRIIIGSRLRTRNVSIECRFKRFTRKQTKRAVPL